MKTLPRRCDIQQHVRASKDNVIEGKERDLIAINAPFREQLPTLGTKCRLVDAVMTYIDIFEEEIDVLPIVIVCWEWHS